MAGDKELRLGTIFYGEMDPSFTAALQKLRGALRATGKAMADTGRKTDKTSSQYQKGEKAARRYGQTQSWVGKQISRVSGTMERLVAAAKVTASYGLAAYAIFSMTRALSGSVQAMTEFDQGLKNIQAITSATEGELGLLQAKIEDVASGTKFSATEVAEALILLGQAGLSASESVDTIHAVAMLATGTLSEMKVTADLLTTALRAFNLEASESGRIADTFASAVNRSKLTIDKLRIAFNYVAPVANKAGLSLEETTTGMMLLANAGLRASTIGTGLRQVLGRLVAPSSKIREAFMAAGADLSKLNPDTASFRDIIGELSKVVKDATTAFELFGLRGAPAISSLTSAGVEGFDKMRSELNRVGVAEQMAEKQMEGLGVMAKNLKDRLGVLAIAIGEGGLTGVLKVVVAALRSFVSLLTEIVKTPVVGHILQFTLVVGGAAGALAALSGALHWIIPRLAAFAAGIPLAILFEYTDALGVGAAYTRVFSSVLVRLRQSLMSVHGVIGLVVVGVAALVTAILAWSESIDEAVASTDQLVSQSEKTVDSLRRYWDQLNQAREGSEEYQITLRRLAREFPQLRKEMDILNGRWRDGGRALDALIKAEEKEMALNYEKSIEAKIEKIEALNVTLADYKAGLDAVIAGEADVFSTLDVTGQKADEVRDQIKDLTDIIIGYILQMAKMRDLDIVEDWDEIEKMIAGVAEKSKEVGEALTEFFEKEKEKQIEAARLAQLQWKEFSDRTQDHFKTLFEEADASERTFLIQSLARLRTRTASFLKEAEKIGVSLYRRMESQATLAVRTELEERAKILEKRGKTEKQILEANIQYIKDRIHAEEGGFQKRLKQIDDSYKEELSHVDKNSKKAMDLQLHYSREIEKERARHSGVLLEYRNQLAESEIALAEETQRQRFDYEQEAANMLASFAEKGTAKIEYENLRRLEKIKDFQEKALAFAREFGIKRKEVEKKVAELTAEAGRRYEMDLARDEAARREAAISAKHAMIDAELAEEESKYQHNADELRGIELERTQNEKEEIKKRIGLKDWLLSEAKDIYGEESTIFKGLQEDKAKLVKKLADAMSKIYKKTADDQVEDIKRVEEQELLSIRQRLAGIQEYSDEYTDIMETLHNLGAVSSQQLAQYYEDMWRRGIVSARKYHTVLQDLHEQEEISTREFTERSAIATSNYFELLQRRASDAFAEYGTLVENAVQITLSLVDKISSGFASAFMDFIEGTKSAKEAFADFAKNTIKWLIEMIVKTLMWKALMFGLGAIGGIGGGAEVVGGGGGAADLHQGGILGKETLPVRVVNPMVFANAPKLHSGLKPDEYPAILQKGEGVFTEEQMKALGQRSTELTIVNVVDQKQFEAFLATPRGKRAVINVVGANAAMLKKVTR